MTRTSAQAPSGMQFRRAALAAGAVAIAALAAALLLRSGPDVDRYLWIGLVAVVAAFLTTHLLVRMWKAEQHAGSRRAVVGRRLAVAFELLFAVTVVLGLLEPPGFVVVGRVLLGAALASLVAAVALAVPRP